MRVQAKALALLLLIGCADPDEGSPTEATLEYLKATIPAGTEWSLVSVVPIAETQTDRDVVAVVTVNDRGQLVSGYFSFTRASGRWAVRHDLIKLLKETVIESDAAARNMAKRCADRLSERYGRMLDITAELEIRPEDQEVEMRDGTPIATVRSEFVYKTLPSRPKGLFVDTYAYQDGEWRLQGTGTLFDGE